MSDGWTERLSEYLDGELDPADREALERHLAQCADCRRALAELRAVVARLGNDPIRESDQPTDLAWARLRVTQQRRRRAPVIRRVAVAAGLGALAIGAGLVWRQQRAGSDPVIQSPAAQLEALLHQTPGRLRPETVRAIAASLATIDSAIAQAERALAADSGNEYVTRALAQLRSTRLSALQQAVILAARY